VAQGREVLADALLILGDEEGVGLDPEAGGFPLGVHRVGGHDSWISRGSSRRLSSGISLVFSSHLDLSDACWCRKAESRWTWVPSFEPGERVVGVGLR